MNLKYVSPAPSFFRGIVRDYNDGYSPIIALCGPMRVSKTTKAFIGANWISGLLFDKPWDWRNDSIVSIDKLIVEMGMEDEGRIYVMDEVEKQLAKKMWQDPESKLFNLLMESQARKHYIIFLIIPKAWQLGSDHAANVNYVLPIHSRSFCYPYHLRSPFWDISLKKKIPIKEPMGYFNINYNDPRIYNAFKDELGERIVVEKKQPNGKIKKEHTFRNLWDFKTYIDVELKDRIMDEAFERRGLFNPRKPQQEGNLHPIVEELHMHAWHSS